MAVPNICFAVQKNGHMNGRERTKENSVSCPYGATLQKDSSNNLPCSWDEPDPSSFRIRGKTYLRNHKKVLTNSKFYLYQNPIVEIYFLKLLEENPDDPSMIEYSCFHLMT